MMKPIIYQMLPRLWRDGKFSSIDNSSFAYMRMLGCSHVWYTGVIRHASGKTYVKGFPGSPYSIEDYYDVNPYLASDPSSRMEEFEDLIRRTHKAGLKVIIDFVPNHVAPDYADGRGGIPLCDYCDYDWTDTKKIDYSRPETWDRMLSIVLFWAAKGVDGFRCDMVELVPPGFLGWMIRAVKEQYPRIVFIAEVYNKDNYRKYVREVGFDYLYDKSGLYDKLKAIIRDGASAREITWNWQFLGDLQPHMLNFLENHDEQRVASPWFAGSAERAIPLLYVSLLFNTAPFMIYFAQELGESAANGAEGRTSIFNWTSVESLDRHNSGILGFGELRLLERYRDVLQLAAHSPAIQVGKTFDLCYIQPEGAFDRDRHFAFLRSDGVQTILVVSNFSDRPMDLDIRIPAEASEYLGVKIPEIFHVAVEDFDAKQYLLL